MLKRNQKIPPTRTNETLGQQKNMTDSETARCYFGYSDNMLLWHVLLFLGSKNK